ncbi:MAG: hypothetical protein H2212_00055 [Ruminococcus sp.]|nr:hypothetical protein [Ruminococcus sp.]
MTQRELEQFLDGYHKRQDISHKQTVERHNEIMDLIEIARKRRTSH